MNTDYLDRHGFHGIARIIGWSRIDWTTIYQMTNAFSRATYERETGMLFVHGPSVSW